MRRRLSKAGGTLVESAIVIPLFFFLMFAVVDVATLFFAQTTLQNAVREAGRYAITGNHQPDPGNPGQQLSRVNSIIAVARQAAMGLNIASIQVSSINGGNGNAGGPGDTVTISLTSNVPLLTPFLSQMFHGAFTLTVSTRFKNESFPPGQAN
jgi:Flp pilus assembly protein TadG